MEGSSSTNWGGAVVQVVTWEMGGFGERWGAPGEALLARPPLTSCCAALFLTGCRPLSVRGPGVGDPWSKGPLLGISPRERKTYLHTKALT